MESHFASPERTPDDELQGELELVTTNPVMTGLLGTVGGLLAVLDANRQILTVNDSFLEMLNSSDPTEVLGLRPGEALNCLHAHEEPGGCGTSRFCSTCGAAIATVAALVQDEPVECLCAVEVDREGQTVDLALMVRALPLEVGSRRFILLFLQDISDEQQRQALERTFFHDVNNLLMGLLGATELFTSGDMQSLRIIQRCALFMHSEVKVQQLLMEGGELEPNLATLDVPSLLGGLKAIYASHPAARGKRVTVSPAATNGSLVTDHALVIRVLANMVTNALEASEPGRLVKVWTSEAPDEVTFNVWNEGFIPEDIALRIFQRNFSTKAAQGRGLGTFAMKLIGEKYLGGQVGFRTSPEDGTFFHLTLPR
jgi:signal transduction histidine kinase